MSAQKTKMQPLNDELNLKDFIIQITQIIRAGKNSRTEPRTLLRFLEIVFAGIFRSTMIKELQKIFSGNIPPQRIATKQEEIVKGEFDTQLRRNLAAIEEAIQSSDATGKEFSKLLQKANQIYFTPEELNQLDQLKESGTKESRIDILLLLVKHGFNNLDNLPCFFARRIYEEALTYNHNEQLRFRLMQTAADNGHKQAALEYGNYKDGEMGKEINDKNKILSEEAFKYTFMALPLNSAMWNMAWQLEHFRLNLEQIEELKNTIKMDEKLASSEFDECRYEMELISCPAEELREHESAMLAYKICFYLAYQGFSKAFNSLGKYCDGRSVEIKIEVKESKKFGTAHELAVYYYKKAIAGGNIMSMHNLANIYFNDIKKGMIKEESEEAKAARLYLSVAASYKIGQDEKLLKEFDQYMKSI